MKMENNLIYLFPLIAILQYYCIKDLNNMSTDKNKQRTRSFVVPPTKSSNKKIEFSPEKSEGKHDRDTNLYRTRFKKKDLQLFQPQYYVTGQLTVEDVIDLKEVFDTYDSTGMGVLLPNDVMLLLNQNGFGPKKNTVYELIAQYDETGCGGISFAEFLKAVGAKPYLNENKKQIASIFKKYDRTNKNYIDINDLREVNRHVKQNLDDQTLKMMLEKADSNADGKISFEDFYSVMVKNYTL